MNKEQIITKGKEWLIKLLPEGIAIPGLSSEEKVVVGDGLVCITISRGFVAIALVKASSRESMTVVNHGFKKTSDAEEQQQFINDFVEKNDLTGYPGGYVLASHDYDLVLIQTPSFTPETKEQVLQDSIREYVEYDPATTKIDLMRLPLKRASDDADVSYAVTLTYEKIVNIEQLVNTSGLKLKSIDTPELAIRNIACLSSEITRGALVMRLHRKGGYIIIVRNISLYLHRYLNLDLNDFLKQDESLDANSMLANSQLDSLTVDIQRSLDYCRSVFRQGVANSIVLMPSELDNDALAECLKQSVGMPVSTVNLTEHFTFKQEVSDEDQVRCLIPIAGALRNCEVLVEGEHGTTS